VATVPTLPTWTAGQRVTGALLQSITTFGNFMGTPPQARLHQAVSQSLANNTFSAITFDSTDIDTYSGHSNVTNNTRYTFQYSGTYLLLGGVSWAASTTGFRQVLFRGNGTASYKKIQAAPSPSFETALQTAVTEPFNAGDYVELMCWQNSGGSLSTVVADQSVWPWMDIYRISG
jgi:hypothetical protein